MRPRTVRVSPGARSPTLATEWMQWWASSFWNISLTRSHAVPTVNRHIRDVGLSPLHHVGRVIRLDEIPLLGTGKTDYRALGQRLR